MLTEIATDLCKQSLAPDEDLLEQGIIDSLGVLKLILFMEEAFGIKVIDEEISLITFRLLMSWLSSSNRKKIMSRLLWCSKAMY